SMQPMDAATKTNGPRSGERWSKRAVRSEVNVSKVISGEDGPEVQPAALRPKPRRSGAMMRKRWDSTRGRMRASNMREDMGQPWRKMRVRGWVPEEDGLKAVDEGT